MVFEVGLEVVGAGEDPIAKGAWIVFLPPVVSDFQPDVLHFEDVVLHAGVVVLSYPFGQLRFASARQQCCK